MSDLHLTERTEPRIIEIAERPNLDPKASTPFVPAWETSKPPLVVTYSFGWAVTHEPTGLRLNGAPLCCLKHAREWVDDLTEDDWSADDVEHFRGSAAHAEALRQLLGKEWRCEVYAACVTEDQAVAVVGSGTGYTDETVRTVLAEALRRKVVALAANWPEVDW